MPSVLIEVRKKYSKEVEVKIIEAVHGALIEHFKIPHHDRNVRLFVHEPHMFQCPPEKTHPELYTHISVDCFAGRSIETKRHLYKGIIENLSHLQIPADHIKILLREMPKENWGIMGGQAACDVELGFNTDI